MFEGNKNCSTLIVECPYLAKQVNRSFDSFYVELLEVAELSLLTWPNPFNLPAQVLSEPKDIFKATLEVLSADISGDAVLIACNQHDTSFDYCGGNLTLSCRYNRQFENSGFAKPKFQKKRKR